MNLIKVGVKSLIHFVNCDMDKKTENILLGLGIIGVLGLILGTRKKFEITKNSNCHELLQQFNDEISIHHEKVTNLKRAYEAIKSKVRNYFQSRTNLPIPDFFIQGSYKMKTLVENRNTKSDVDLAVIFPCEPRVRLETLQNHIKNALWNHTTKGIVMKERCVRLTYVKDFHIDLPIYYKDEDGQIYFGSKGDLWEPSDPKAFVEWFKFNTMGKPQLVRLIRYLKAWADHTKIKSGKKFPSGLVLTLWTIKYYQHANRDDVALFKTSTAILKYLNDNFKFQWSAKMPVVPKDNTLSRLTNSQKSGFYGEFKTAVSIMAGAVSSERQSSAISKWKRVFGGRFNDN